MLESSEDAYRELVEESDEGWLYGLVAFPILEERRIEWMHHRAATTGTMPSGGEIRDWYEQQPTGELLRMKGDAEAALAVYAGKVEEELLERHRQEIQSGVIVSEIRQGQRLWPQFGVAVGASLAGAVIFTAVLVILAFFLLRGEPSVGELVREMERGSGEEVTENSEESRSNE